MPNEPADPRRLRAAASYLARHNSGVCANGHPEPAVPGRRLCRYCLDRMAARTAERRQRLNDQRPPAVP